MWRYTLLVVVAVYGSLSTLAHSEDIPHLQLPNSWYGEHIDLREDTLHHVREYTKRGFVCEFSPSETAFGIECNHQSGARVLFSSVETPGGGENCKGISAFATCDAINFCGISMRTMVEAVENTYGHFIVERGFRLFEDSGFYDQCFLSSDYNQYCLVSNSSDHMDPVFGFYWDRPSNCS